MTDLITPAVVPELRHALVQVCDLEMRDATSTGDGSFTVTGHAAVFNQETTLYDGSWFRLREKIAPTAFDDVLSRNPDVHLNIGHDMTRAIARTGRSANQIGGLELSVDKRGLRFFARVDPEDPDVVALQRKMRHGIIDQASFAFTVGEDERSVATGDDGFEDELRVIRSVKELYDVTVVAQGAYAQTNSNIRSLMAAIQGRAISGPDSASLPPEGAPIVAPAAVGGLDLRRAQMRADARIRLARAKTTIRRS
jgi:HK97 family phage prohead protease